jgi:hypothetical protein
MAESERDWIKPAAIALSKEDYFEMERGRYGPVYPRTPACPCGCSARPASRPCSPISKASPEDWKENPEACVRFVREYQCPSFLEYGEYPYVTADEIKKALRRKAAFSDMLDQMCWIGCSRPPMCKPRWTAPTTETRWRSHEMGSARCACPRIR